MQKRFFESVGSSRYLLSFPTRRSSDLRRRTGRGRSRPAFAPNCSAQTPDRKSTRLNSSHVAIAYAVFCSKKKMSERLEKVHQGLGAMQQLASDVGGLQRVLTNVKARGGWGEVQLGALLEQLLTSEQFDRNVQTRDESGERVDYAIKLPGEGNGA